jgi:16S rRNA (uracil1498-N3)-methyltransferase
MSLAHFLVANAAADGESVVLEDAEAKHARVRRVRRGEQIVVLDGGGWSAVAVVDSIGDRAVTARIVRTLPLRHGESPLDLTLAVALLKSDRFDWIVEKATELGVTRIRPFTSQYSLAEPSAARRKRWQQIAVSAAKQCGRTVAPEVHAPVPFGTVVRDYDGAKYLFAEGGAEATLTANEKPGTVSVLVGPEGGFTTEEREQAKSFGCRLVTLGPRILRAETAAIAALTLCQHAFGDLALLPAS